jgi:uncharacterized membrane protein
MSEEIKQLDKDRDRIQDTRFHKVIKLLTLVVLIAMIIYPVIMWNTLPDKLPMHYNAAGEIDRWGGRGETLILPVIGILMYGLLTLVTSFPSAWNIPVQITRENRGRVYQCTKSMLVLMKLEVIVIFAYLEYQVIGQRELAGSFLGIVIFTIFGTMIYFIRRMYKVAKRRIS